MKAQSEGEILNIHIQHNYQLSKEKYLDFILKIIHHLLYWKNSLRLLKSAIGEISILVNGTNWQMKVQHLAVNSLELITTTGDQILVKMHWEILELSFQFTHGVSITETKLEMYLPQELQDNLTMFYWKFNQDLEFWEVGKLTGN